MKVPVCPLLIQNGVSPPKKKPPFRYSPVVEERKVKFAVPVALTRGMEVMLMEKETVPEEREV